MHAPSPLPRTALLTGVGRRRGIAAAIARGLAADGYDLALNFHSPYDQRVLGEDADVEQLAEELRAGGTRVALLPGDLEDPAVAPRPRAPAPAGAAPAPADDCVASFGGADRGARTLHVERVDGRDVVVDADGRAAGILAGERPS